MKSKRSDPGVSDPDPDPDPASKRAPQTHLGADTIELGAARVSRKKLPI
jgi:hypothetical protein